MVSFGITHRSAIGARFASFATARQAAATERQLLKVSYDPTRELHRATATAFIAVWPEQTSDQLVINQSQDSSAAQSRAIQEGLQADVVTLALVADIDVLARYGLLAEDWQKRLPDNACPHTSTIVFPVRKGNPKRIQDWTDLIRPAVGVITRVPKTSGGTRWHFLAARAWPERQPGRTTASTEAHMSHLFDHVPVLDTGARGAGDILCRRRYVRSHLQPGKGAPRPPRQQPDKHHVTANRRRSTEPDRWTNRNGRTARLDRRPVRPTSSEGSPNRRTASHRTDRVANAARWLITGGPSCHSIAVSYARM